LIGFELSSSPILNRIVNSLDAVQRFNPIGLANGEEIQIIVGLIKQATVFQIDSFGLERLEELRVDDEGSVKVDGNFGAAICVRLEGVEGY
jgi:hypothetical protein